MSVQRQTARIDFPALFRGHQPQPARFGAMAVRWEGSPIHLLRPSGPAETDALVNFVDIVSKAGVRTGLFHLEHGSLAGTPGISDRFAEQCEALICALEDARIIDPGEIEVTLAGNVAYAFGDEAEEETTD